MMFIVHNDTQNAPTVVLMKSTSCWKNVPKGGILRIGSLGHAVGFDTRAEAQGFIDRTVAYDSNSAAGRRCGPDHYEIYRVRPFLDIK